MSKLNVCVLKKLMPTRIPAFVALFGFIIMSNIPMVQAAIALDRTRAVFNEGEKSISLNISNDNPELPYLAQAWIEDKNGIKVKEPFIVLPPVQRVEPGSKSQVKIQALPNIASLANDRESVYYFNLREIPPKSNKANTLQLALQTRIKLFYRPKSIVPNKQQTDNPWQEKLILKHKGDQYEIINPTPYYVTIVNAMSHKNGDTVKGFSSLMIEPKGTDTLNVSAQALGNSPVLTYINDYGGRPTLQFSCQDDICNVVNGNK